MPRNGIRSLALVLTLIAGSAIAMPTWTYAAASAGPEERAPDDASIAPLRKITLYRSGVGYFERSGQIQGDAQIQLRFPTDQINDILKSMVLLDLGGGRIETVTYASKEPLQRRLASFGVDISGNPSIPDLLAQLRGAKIRVVAAGESVSGTILGIEERPVQLTKDAPAIMAPFLNIVSDDALRSVAISAVSSFELLDKDLSGELSKALAALAEYRADRTKNVDIRLGANGVAGARQVVVGYIHEMPVWKTSYRLILPDDGAAGASPAGAKKRTVALQGWAIVENNTDQDWENIRLSLVSGRPVSFQMDLYEPLFVERPVVPVPTIPGVAPRAYQAGSDMENISLFSGADRDAEKAAGKRIDDVPQIQLRAALGRAQSGGGAGGQSPFRDDQERWKEISPSDMSDYAAAVQAAGGEVGEVFQYELQAPVSIERQHSAMIPILSASMSGRRVSIFNIADGSDHPMRGVEITNDSDLQLLPGPISVFDGNDNKSAYAGDAQIGHVPGGDKRLLAYAVDLDVDAVTKADSDSTVTSIKIVSGMFEQTSRERQATSYAFQNKDAARARTILVEQPRLEGYDLVTPKAAAETTKDYYRFEIPVEAGKGVALLVAQERVLSQRIGILDTYSMDDLLAFAKNGRLSQKVLDAVRDLGARQAAINDADRVLKDMDKQVADITADQDRIRSNMGQIDRNSQLYTRYMTKLSEQETKLEDLDQAHKAQQEKIDQMRRDYDAYLRTLNVD